MNPSYVQIPSHKTLREYEKINKFFVVVAAGNVNQSHIHNWRRI